MKLLRKKYFRALLLITAIVIVFTPVISVLSFTQEENVKTFIDKVAHQLINTIKNPNTFLKNKRNKVKDIINNNFDVTWMSKFVMGINYRKLSNNQKKRYQSLYLNYLLSNYFPILEKYDSDDSYEILKIQQVDTKDYDAKIRLVTKKNKNPIMLKYRIRCTYMNYKCLDMIVEGVSTLISQRAEFTSVIQHSGIKFFLNKLEIQNIKVTNSFYSTRLNI